MLKSGAADGVGAAHRTIARLTSLRFLAAFLVMLSHLDFLAASPSAIVRGVYEHGLRQGFCGVSFFFILSGFILTHAYGDRLRSGQVKMGDYLARRVLRIAPLHWLVGFAFITWLVAAEGRTVDPATLVLNMTLLHSWDPASTVHYSLNGPSWSLSDELFFYAVFPALVALRTRTLSSAFAAALVILIAAAIAVSLRQPGYSNTVDWGFYVNPVARLVDFTAGILIYRLVRSGHVERFAGTRTELAALVLVPLTMVAASLADVPLPLRYQLIYLLPMAAVVAVFACGRGAVSRLLGAPTLVLLGEASFALYLVHRPLFTLAAQLAHHWFGTSLDVVLAAALLVIGPLAAVAVHRLVDVPLQAGLRHRLAAIVAARQRMPSPATSHGRT